MPKGIDVSIIVVNYNQELLLRQCVQSIIANTSEINYQIIIVDNGSGSFNGEDFLRDFPDVTIILNKSNIGFASANNAGLQIADGKYILFLNNDTLLRDNIIKNVFDFAEKSPQRLFLGCQLLNSDLSRQESVAAFPTVWNSFTENFFLYKLFPRSRCLNKYYQNEIMLTEPAEADVIRGAFMFCPLEEIRKLNGFDANFFFYSEETDLCYRFKRSGGKIYFLPGFSVVHYGGITSDKDLWFKYKNQATGKIQYYQKHFKGIRFSAALVFHYIGLLLRWILNLSTGLLFINKNKILKGYYFLRQIFVYPPNRFGKTEQV